MCKNIYYLLLNICINSAEIFISDGEQIDLITKIIIIKKDIHELNLKIDNINTNDPKQIKEIQEELNNLKNRIITDKLPYQKEYLQLNTLMLLIKELEQKLKNIALIKKI